MAFLLAFLLTFLSICPCVEYAKFGISVDWMAYVSCCVFCLLLTAVVGFFHIQRLSPTPTSLLQKFIYLHNLDSPQVHSSNSTFPFQDAQFCIPWPTPLAEAAVATAGVATSAFSPLPTSRQRYSITPQTHLKACARCSCSNRSYQTVRSTLGILQSSSRGN